MNAAKIIQETNMELYSGRITLEEYKKRIEPFKDVESVVRCKDCRYGMWIKNIFGEDRIACILEESFVQDDRALPPDWFCADGEAMQE